MHIKLDIKIINKTVIAEVSIPKVGGLTPAEEEAFKLLGTWGETISLGGTIPGDGATIADFELPSNDVQLFHAPFKTTFDLNTDSDAYGKANLWAQEISERILTIKDAALADASGLQAKSTIISG